MPWAYLWSLAFITYNSSTPLFLPISEMTWLSAIGPFTSTTWELWCPTVMLHKMWAHLIDFVFGQFVWCFVVNTSFCYGVEWWKFSFDEHFSLVWMSENFIIDRIYRGCFTKLCHFYLLLFMIQILWSYSISLCSTHDTFFIGFSFYVLETKRIPCLTTFLYGWIDAYFYMFIMLKNWLYWK